MTAPITMGAIRPHTALSMRLPAIPTDSAYHFPQSDLSYSQTPTGVLVTCNGLLVAWIFKGHAGRSRNNIAPCQFYDVAFPSITFGQQNRITGLMLDSDSFDTLAEAVQFVEATFAGGAA